MIRGDTKTTLGEALSIMKKHNLINLPIYKESCQELLGILDAQAIIFYLAFGKYNKQVRSTPVWNGDATFASQLVSELLSCSVEACGAWMFQGNDPVMKALEAFSKGIHRAVIRCEEKNNTNATVTVDRILTQSDLVRWLAQQSSIADPLFKQSVSQLDMMSSTVISMNSHESALDGFRRMFMKEVPALAIVDGVDGRLVGTLSGYDLRGIPTEQEGFRVIEQKVELLNEGQHIGTTQQTISSNTPLLEAVNKMLAYHLHRVWVIDPAHKPIGVIALSDVLQKCYQLLSNNK